MGRLVLAAVLALCAFAWRMYDALDMGRTVYNHRPGVCTRVHGPVKGSEDIELIRSERIAFVTSGVIYLQPHRASVEGKIFVYNYDQQLESDQINAKQLPIYGDSFDQANFHPHGLSHWVVNGVIRLYVINHDNAINHSIEVFDYEPTEPALVHKKSIKHPSFVRPNDLVAVGAEQFILTNDGVSQSEMGNLFETLIGYNGGTVVYWDGKNSHNLLTSMGVPNGIAYDFENEKLLVMEVKYRRMHVYDLSEDKETLAHRSTINLYSSCDNLFLDDQRTVYTGCHPILHETAWAHGDCDDDARTSSSQVLRVRFDEDYKSAVVTEPYANDGSEISLSSVAVVFEKQMLVGTVCKGLLHCEIAVPAAL